MSQTNWYYQQGSQPVGPVSADVLRQLASAGVLLPTTPVLKVGTPTWIPAATSEVFPGGVGFGPAAPPSTTAPAAAVTPSQPSFSAWWAVLDIEKRLFLIAAGTGILATFLPWYHVPILGSVWGASGDGWITFALFGAVVGVVLLTERSQPLLNGSRLACLIAGLLAAVVGIWKILSLNELAEHRSRARLVTVGIGVYLVIGAGITTLAAAGRPLLRLFAAQAGARDYLLVGTAGLGMIASFLPWTENHSRFVDEDSFPGSQTGWGWVNPPGGVVP
jgi:hypothetical protein